MHLGLRSVTLTSVTSIKLNGRRPPSFLFLPVWPGLRILQLSRFPRLAIVRRRTRGHEVGRPLQCPDATPVIRFRNARRRCYRPPCHAVSVFRVKVAVTPKEPSTSIKRCRLAHSHSCPTPRGPDATPDFHREPTPQTIKLRSLAMHCVIFDASLYLQSRVR